MFENIENLKIKNISKGISKRKSSIICRKTNGFIIRPKGQIVYSFPDHSIDLKADEIIFLPRGIAYEYEVVSEEALEYINITFESEYVLSTPAVYSLEGFQSTDELVNQLANLWKLGTISDHFKCYSIFYHLLAYIENLESQAYMDKKKSYLIAPAISYLKEHLYDCDLRIDTLCELCGISGTYFRRIFQANYAQSPHQYIISKRLSHAKTIIDSGDYNTISEVAITVGFNDSLYFGQAFKKKYGVSPSQYEKEGYQFNS